MKKLLMICVTTGLVLFFFAASAAASITTYTDRSAWEYAVNYLTGSYLFGVEFFTDATLNPGVSVVSTYPGNIDTTKGVWSDKLVCPEYGGPTTTTWQFDSLLFGYGGNWNPGEPGGPGANISVSFDGSWTFVGEVPNTYTGEFWGFVSTDPFSKVRLEPGSACNGAWCETYELDNMVYALIPEPCTLFLLALGGLAVLRKQRT